MADAPTPNVIQATFDFWSTMITKQTELAISFLDAFVPSSSETDAGKAWPRMFDQMFKMWNFGSIFGKATEDTAADIVTSLHRTRGATGTLTAEELPIRHYDELTVEDIVNRLGRIKDVAEVEAILAYENHTKARKGVLTAAETRVEELMGRDGA